MIRVSRHEFDNVNLQRSLRAGIVVFSKEFLTTSRRAASSSYPLSFGAPSRLRLTMRSSN